MRAKEQFSGTGHKTHVCKRCQRLPKSERRAIEDRDDIFGFMQQSHISKKNVARLEQLAKSETPQVASLAAIVLEVARVTPYKRRRLKIIARNHRDLRIDFTLHGYYSHERFLKDRTSVGNRVPLFQWERRKGHCASPARVSARIVTPRAMSSGAANSSGRWLYPFRQGINSMATGAMREINSES